jgi:hypothetical protein
MDNGTKKMFGMLIIILPVFVPICVGVKFTSISAVWLFIIRLPIAVLSKLKFPWIFILLIVSGFVAIDVTDDFQSV